MDPRLDVQAMIRRHLLAGVALLVAMGIAVGLALANAPIGSATASAILLLAVVQAVVIATVLMHLSRERSILMAIIALTVIQLVGLLIVPALGHFDRARF